MIGIFDSGYGGLSVMRQIRRLMPEYDYLYLGDNARAPYGPRSYDVVYHYTLQAVEALFARGCELVILACNTASAKALRTIQQHDLQRLGATRRVLGVIRPTVEAIGDITRTRHIGILATQGTVGSMSYNMELAKLFPDIHVTAQACPMRVPLVEYGEYDTPGADYFVKKRIDAVMAADSLIDTLVLACTHYPLLMDKIRRYAPPAVKILPQGEIIAASLKDYLYRHPEMDVRLQRHGTARFLTTEDPQKFCDSASIFMPDTDVRVERIQL